MGERLPNKMERQYLETVHPSWISESWRDEVVDVQPCKVQDRYPFVVWDDKWVDSDDELPNAESVGHVSPVPILWRPKFDQSSESRSRWVLLTTFINRRPCWRGILTRGSVHSFIVHYITSDHQVDRSDRVDRADHLAGLIY